MTGTNESISDQDIVAAVRSSTQEVFSTMLGLEITPGEQVAEQRPAGEHSSRLVSLIGLAGTWSGTGSLACSGEFACAMASSLLASSFEAVNDEVLDAVGEITNMIIGNVKTALEEKLGAMGLSTPTVIFGRNFQTRSARIHDWTVVSFDSGPERMSVQLCLTPNGASQKTTLRPGFQIPQALTV
jgi:chemotaxis protein CheX